MGRTRGGWEWEDNKGWEVKKKKKAGRRLKKSKRKTYSIKNHVYFEKDDPFCWPCQLLAFQDVGFAFSILDLWERDMTGVCLAIPGWIGSPGHLWTPAAAADREPKTTVATLTSTCSLPTAARLCQTEINYPGESYCYSKAQIFYAHTSFTGYLYFLPNIRSILLSPPSRSFPSISVIFISSLIYLLYIFSAINVYLSLYSALPFISASCQLFLLWEIISVISGVAKITSAFYIFPFLFSVFLCCMFSLYYSRGRKKKKHKQKSCLWLTFSKGIATFPRKSALLSRSSS